MPREIYMRDPSDPNYKDGILEVSNELEMLIGQIKMILFTNAGEVLGAPDFGVNLEEQLFTLNLNEYRLKKLLQDHMMKFCPLSHKYRVSFEVSFAKGTVRDVCLIDVIVNDENVFGVLVK